MCYRCKSKVSCRDCIHSYFYLPRNAWLFVKIKRTAFSFFFPSLLLKVLINCKTKCILPFIAILYQALLQKNDLENKLNDLIVAPRHASSSEDRNLVKHLQEELRNYVSFFSFLNYIDLWFCYFSAIILHFTSRFALRCNLSLCDAIIFLCHNVFVTWLLEYIKI